MRSKYPIYQDQVGASELGEAVSKKTISFYEANINSYEGRPTRRNTATVKKIQGSLNLGIKGDSKFGSICGQWNITAEIKKSEGRLSFNDAYVNSLWTAKIHNLEIPGKRYKLKKIQIY